MARTAVGWGIRDLASAAETSPDTVARFERGEMLRHRTVDALRTALEAAGVIFLNEGEDADGGPGVRLGRTTQGDFSIPGDQLNSSNDD